MRILPSQSAVSWVRSFFSSLFISSFLRLSRSGPPPPPPIQRAPGTGIRSTVYPPFSLSAFLHRETPPAPLPDRATARSSHLKNSNRNDDGGLGSFGWAIFGNCSDSRIVSFNTVASNFNYIFSLDNRNRGRILFNMKVHG